MEMHMIHLLMRNAPVVLQDIVVLGTGCDDEFFEDRLSVGHRC
jgi:hypothetical protein